MNDRINTNLRKWISLIISICLFYIIHEGSHLICALILGAFEKIRFLGLGVQIVINDKILSDLQLAIFCVVGSIFSLIFGYLIVLFTKKLVSLKSKYLKAIGYYTTIALLFIDPLYLAILYKFFGGGDMNGIILFGIPEVLIQIIYGVIGVINLVIFIKYVFPKYKESFKE